MDKLSISTRIIEIVASHNLCKVADIIGSTRIYDDLKISGDDAQDLLNEITNEFHITFDNFDVCKRFPTEQDERSFFFLIEKIFGQKKTYIVTTVDDLINYVLERLEEERETIGDQEIVGGKETEIYR